VSLSNFLGGIILVRALGLSEFGKYTIAYAFLLYANSLQMSFIASPMLSLAPLMEAKEKRRFVEGMLTIQILASLLLFLIFAAAGAVSLIFTTFFPLRTVFAFACCVGTFQLQDWLRRYYFLSHKGKLALASDFISYVVQGVFLAGTAILGTAMAGGLRAAQNIAGPLYLFLLALENVVPIRIAEELKRRGPAGAQGFTQRAIFAGAAASGIIILPIAVFGRTLLRHIYGPALVPFYLPMLLTLLSVVLQGMISMWVYFYRGIRDSRAILFTSGIITIGSMTIVYWFGHIWQASGIVSAVLFGQVLALGYCILHWKLSRKNFLFNYQESIQSADEGAVSLE